MFRVVFTEMSASLVRQEPTVFVVDSDPRVATSARLLARSIDFQLDFYPQAEDFFAACDPRSPGCILLNLDLPELCGLRVFERLAAGRIHLPVVALSDCGDVAFVVQALKAGAVDYLQKPCGEAELERALREALQWDSEHRRDIALALKVRHRMDQLTPAEHEVLQRLIEGLSNREVAAELGLSVRAIEERRARLMEKMKAKNLAELVRMALAARFRCTPRLGRLE